MELENGKENNEVKKNSSLLYCCIKWPSSIKSPPTSSSEKLSSGFSDEDVKTKTTTTTERKPGGWRAMPFVLGNETFERLASFGLSANFTVFLMTIYHMDQVSASNLTNMWSCISNFTPLVGAFISDSYIGRFWTIAISSFAQLLGMLMLTIIAVLPRLRPPPCTAVLGGGDPQCPNPTRTHIGYLIMGLGLLSIGTGGIRPCSIPFGVDQFDSSTEEGRKGINSFFNWYYTSFTIVLIIATTLVVYIQNNISWVLGFALPAGLMACGIGLFFLGTSLYVYAKPQGSIFTNIARVIVSAYKKRKVKLSNDNDAGGGDVVYYDPPPPIDSVVTKLTLTNECRFLNKAAVVMEGDVNSSDGKCNNPWRLSSIQQMEEVKCIVRILPLWLGGFFCPLAILQQFTFTISQALTMDRHFVAHNFKIPPGSLFVVSLLTIAIWLPFYDQILVPRIRRRTGNEGGITTLQRMGVGNALILPAMIVSGLVEIKRRSTATSGSGAPLSVVWLFPQLIIMGLAEAFNILGQIEFYNKEFPENMISVGNSLSSVTWGVASYLSTVLVNVIHKTTAVNGKPDWLTRDINEGRVENYYFVVAGLGLANLVYFVVVARRYRYKNRVIVNDDVNKV